MSILSKFLKNKVSKTPLEEFLRSITVEQSQETYRSVKNDSLKFPSALSIWALYLAHRFSNSLREMLSGLEKQLRTSNGNFPYDAVVFEAAAYCYYWLMRDLLNADDETYDDEDENTEEDGYFECLKMSANITSSIIDGKVPFDLSNELIMKRIMAYSFEEKCKSVSPEEKFSQFLISSMQSRSPQLRTAVNIESSLPLQLSVATYIPTFESTLLSEFKKSARVMFLAHQEGVL